MGTNIPDNRELNDLFAKAFELEEEGSHEQALEIRESLLRNEPANEHFIIAFARSLVALGRSDEAERYYRKAIFIFPCSELSSLQLFHFLLGADRSDDAFIELQRFQSIAHSDDYDCFVRTLNDGDSA